jgi:hypothetical protein
MKLMRPTLRLVLAAALLALSAADASAQSNDNLIVPGQRIGPVYIGMTSKNMKRVLGPPDAAFRLSQNIYAYRWGDWKNPRWWVYASRGGAFRIDTALGNFKTVDGIGAGIPEEKITAKWGQPKRLIIQAGNTHILCYDNIEFTVENDRLSHVTVPASVC